MFFFPHVLAPGRGRQPIGDKNFMTTESPYHFAHLLQFKKIALKSDFIYIFFMFHHIMYTAPGRGRQSIGGQNFDDNRKAFSLCPICCKFQNDLFEI